MFLIVHEYSIEDYYHCQEPVFVVDAAQRAIEVLNHIKELREFDLDLDKRALNLFPQEPHFESVVPKPEMTQRMKFLNHCLSTKAPGFEKLKEEFKKEQRAHVEKCNEWHEQKNIAKEKMIDASNKRKDWKSRNYNVPSHLIYLVDHFADFDPHYSNDYTYIEIPKL